MQLQPSFTRAFVGTILLGYGIDVHCEREDGNDKVLNAQEELNRLQHVMDDISPWSDGDQPESENTATIRNFAGHRKSGLHAYMHGKNMKSPRRYFHGAKKLVEKARPGKGRKDAHFNAEQETDVEQNQVEDQEKPTRFAKHDMQEGDGEVVDLVETDADGLPKLPEIPPLPGIQGLQADSEADFTKEADIEVVTSDSDVHNMSHRRAAKSKIARTDTLGSSSIDASASAQVHHGHIWIFVLLSCCMLLGLCFWCKADDPWTKLRQVLFHLQAWSWQLFSPSSTRFAAHVKDDVR